VLRRTFSRERVVAGVLLLWLCVGVGGANTSAGQTVQELIEQAEQVLLSCGDRTEFQKGIAAPTPRLGLSGIRRIGRSGPHRMVSVWPTSGGAGLGT